MCSPSKVPKGTTAGCLLWKLPEYVSSYFSQKETEKINQKLIKWLPVGVPRPPVKGEGGRSEGERLARSSLGLDLSYVNGFLDSKKKT